MSTTEDHKESSSLPAGRQVYEVGYLVLPSIPEDRLSEVVDSIREIIKKQGGQEIDSENPTKLDLAYTMSKNVGASHYVVSDAYVGWIKFDLPTTESAGDEHPVQVIKSKIDKMDNILRFLLIKAPRETYFTFAEARARLAEAEAEEKEGEKVESSEDAPTTPEETKETDR
ncbi:MAG: 30S ribosomal protein S6 [Parcubacteria group bacterium]